MKYKVGQRVRVNGNYYSTIPKNHICRISKINETLYMLKNMNGLLLNFREEWIRPTSCIQK